MNSVQLRLQVMMFLQFFVWGAWFATLGLCLGSNGLEGFIGSAYGTAPLAAIIAPLFLGLVADRFFPSEKVMGVLFLIAGAIMCAVPGFVESKNTDALYWLFLGHLLCYMPTLGLSNTIAFTNIADQNDFPKIRVWGTIGWIVAGLVVGFAGWSATPKIMWVAGIASLVMGVYSFVLPHTPPPAKGKPADLRTVFMLDAMQLLTNPPFFVFILCSTLICIPLAYYYGFTSNLLGQVGYQAAASTMTLGQMSEIFFMLLIPFFFRRLGVKWMILVGMAAWVIRYLLFAFAAPDQVRWMILLAVLLHGVCYDFFFVTGFMYTDQKAPKDIRGQAQGMLVFFTQGVGMFFGYMIAGILFGSTMTSYSALDLDMQVANAQQLIAKADADVSTTALQQAIADSQSAISGGDVDDIKAAADTLKKVVSEFPGVESPSFAEQLGQMFTAELPEGIDQQLLSETMAQWKQFWLVPAGMAAAIMVLFALTFFDRKASEEAIEAVEEQGAH
ncbi:nucleoside permease [Aeoliella sp.]|uniref:nucleoside permease n=1 Tax=Aeoliella sp. TaxID=2795800 RepID=UPI003CCBF781